MPREIGKCTAFLSEPPHLATSTQDLRDAAGGTSNSFGALLLLRFQW